MAATQACTAHSPAASPLYLFPHFPGHCVFTKGESLLSFPTSVGSLQTLLIYAIHSCLWFLCLLFLSILQTLVNLEELIPRVWVFFCSWGVFLWLLLPQVTTRRTKTKVLQQVSLCIYFRFPREQSTSLIYIENSLLVDFSMKQQK